MSNRKLDASLEILQDQIHRVEYKNSETDEHEPPISNSV